MTAARAAVVAFALAAGLVAVDAQAPQQPVFRAGANVVLVDVYPRQNGQVVEGLTAGDFEVFEDGRPQRIENIEFVRVDPSQPESARRDPNNLRDMIAQAADPKNRVFVAFLDTPHVAVEGGITVRRTLVDALNRLVGPDDLFGVTTPNQRATDLTLGRRAHSVEDQLSRYWTWGQAGRAATDREDPMEVLLTECFEWKWILKRSAGGGESVEPIPWIVDDEGVQRPFHQVLIERRREDRTFTSLENIVTHLGAMREARSALMPITGGWRLVPRASALAQEPYRRPEDYRWVDPQQIGMGTGQGAVGRIRGRTGDPLLNVDSCRRELERLAELDHPRRLTDLVTRATRNNVSFFPVAIAGLEASDPKLIYRNDVPAGQSVIGAGYQRMVGRVEILRTLADGTGGLAVVNTNDIGAGLRRVADELSSYYLLAYSPTNTRRDGQYRRIEVRLKRPGVTVRARPGYVASEAVAATTPGAPVPDPAVRAVEEALGALGRRRASDLVVAAAVDGLDLVTVVEVSSTFAFERREDRAVAVEATGADGTRLAAVAATIPAGARGTLVRLPIGGSSGPWRVTATVTGARTTRDTIEAAVRPSAFAGEPVVFRATPSPRSPLYPVADLQFSRTERLRVEWPVIDAAEAVARLLDRQGRALAGNLPVTVHQAERGPVLAVDLTLGPFPEGEYLVELRVGRGAVTERKLQAFRVVR